MDTAALPLFERAALQAAGKSVNEPNLDKIRSYQMLHEALNFDSPLLLFFCQTSKCVAIFQQRFFPANPFSRALSNSFPVLSSEEPVPIRPDN